MNKLVLLFLLGTICAIKAQEESGIENPIVIPPTTTTTTTIATPIDQPNKNENDEDRSDLANPENASDTTLTTVDDDSTVSTVDDDSTVSTVDDDSTVSTNHDESTVSTVDDESTTITTDDDGLTASTTDDSTETTITTEDDGTTTTNGNQKPPSCPQAGFFPYQSCEDYLYCVVIDNKMTGLKFSCPEGMQYNPVLGFCDATYDCNKE